MTARLLVLHGPNLNLLGLREPEVYGRLTLSEINQRLQQRAASEDATVETFQSNHEGGLIDRVHQAKVENIDFIVINPAGLTHTSVALRDALVGVDIPFIEVHLSNIHRREAFRHQSFLSSQALGVICGFGWQSYLFALEFALDQLKPA